VRSSWPSANGCIACRCPIQDTGGILSIGCVCVVVGIGEVQASKKTSPFTRHPFYARTRNAFLIFCLPVGSILGGLSTPLSGGRSASGIPVGSGSLAPLTSGSGGRSSLPLTTSGEAGLDGGNTLLLNAGELLLLNLLLGLSLGVAVWEWLVELLQIKFRIRKHIQK